MGRNVIKVTEVIPALALFLLLFVAQASCIPTPPAPLRVIVDATSRGTSSSTPTNSGRLAMEEEASFAPWSSTWHLFGTVRT